MWQYLPVEVPPGTAALRVTLTYERTPAAILDLGCMGPSGFRGWSGGERDSFTVAASWATPGYLPGELEPGEWQVILGLHMVPGEGVPYRVTAELVSALPDIPEISADPEVPSSRPARRTDLPAAPGRQWLAGDLHSHTVHSDGVMTVPELAAFAAERGLDFLAITDHNTVSHHAELPSAAARYGVTLLHGQEVTTAYGHANVFGDTGWIDFRRSPDDWLASAEAHGGLMSVNHPIAGPCSWMHPMDRRPPLVEVWHWSWLDLSWTTPLAWWQAWSPDTIPVGGSDWHKPGNDAPLATPTTWVEAESPASDAILAALEAGRVTISAGRDGPVLLRHDGELVAIGADGLVLAGPAGGYRRIKGDLARLPSRPGYHRLLTPSGHAVALCP
jgi:hypothetical protein